MTLNLYLEHYLNDANDDDNVSLVSLESVICLFLLEYIDRPSNVIVHLVESNENTNIKSETSLKINVAHLNHVQVSQIQFQNEIVSNCNFPVLLTDKNVVIAGLCGVCRNLIKNADECYIDLLGFKGSTLMAPSEASIWTKFCEVDIFECTKQILQLRAIKSSSNQIIDLQDELIRFESHMAEPIRMHNVYKHARDIEKEQKKQKQEDLEEQLKKLSIDTKENPNKEKNVETKVKRFSKKKKINKIPSGIPIESLNIDHKYVEGTQFSIADIILYPHFWITRTVLSSLSKEPEMLAQYLPLTFKWLNGIESENSERLLNCIAFYDIRQNFQAPIGSGLLSFHVSSVQKFSLYKSDPKRYKPKNRVFTKQGDIEFSLDKVRQLNISVSSNAEETLLANQMLNDADFEWESMPYAALPDAVDLPEKRLARKRHQLDSLAKQIIRIAKDGDRIVDFCSGTGHLGIILAYKLPKCQVILLENKEESLMRARSRVVQLKLTNVLLFQCNLDYFHGKFNIGTSLHACGVATDIVLLHCISHRANFVCCPCCYGGCYSMPHITYPRSQTFCDGGISTQDYMHLAHCADQSHVMDKGSSNLKKCEQGQFCMDVVDTDRKMYAEELGYRVMLCRLHPENCTPKNRLLVGVYYQ